MRMPGLFIGHGSPMNTLERNDFTEAWRAIGQKLPKPRAVVIVSAHWFFGATAVTATDEETDGHGRARKPSGNHGAMNARFHA